MKRQPIKNAVFFCAGLFITMPIVTVGLGDRLVSLFSIAFALMYLSMLTIAVAEKTPIRLAPKSLALLLWFATSIFSTLVGVAYFSEQVIWQNNALSYLPKILLFSTILLIALKIADLGFWAGIFLRGFILGCLLNLVWSIVEGFSFYLFNTALNDELFQEFAKTLPAERPYLTNTGSGIIRAAGLNYDPAHLGGIIPIVFVYSLFKKNVYTLSLALASLVFSGSTTAFASCVLALAISLGKGLIYNKNSNAIKMRGVGFSVLLVFVTLVIVFLNDVVFESITNNIEGFYNRTSQTYVESNELGPRGVYHLYLPEAVANSGVKVLTGTGFGTASHPYVSDASILKLLQEESYTPYDPESTYISYLFDTGIIGLILYIFTLMTTLIFYRRRLNNGQTELIIYAALCSTLFAGLFYHYTLTAYQILILILAVALTNNHACHSNPATRIV